MIAHLLLLLQAKPRPPTMRGNDSPYSLESNEEEMRQARVSVGANDDQVDLKIFRKFYDLLTRSAWKAASWSKPLFMLSLIVGFF